MAIAAVPLVVVPAQQGYANASSTASVMSTPEVIDRLHTIVLPEHGIKLIDLNSVFDRKYKEFRVTYTDSIDASVAKFNNEFLSKGLLYIEAISSGKAAFTVTAMKREGTGTQTDSVDVIVVPADGYTRFDIAKAIELMGIVPAKYQTKEQVKELISTIKPITVNVDESYNQEGNIAPKQAVSSPPIEAIRGIDKRDFEIQERIYDYFRDPNEDQLDLVITSTDENYVHLTNEYRGSLFVGQHLTFIKAGQTEISVLVKDGKGGITAGKIPIDIRNNEIRIAETISLDMESSHTVDLRDYFPEMNAPTFVLDEFPPNYEGEKIIAGNNYTFYLHPGTYKIRATDSQKTEHQEFIVKESDRLKDRNVLSKSSLSLDIKSFFLSDAPNSAFTYSYKQQGSSVTGITYEAGADDYLYINTDNAQQGYPISTRVAVTAKDIANHHIYVDTIKVQLYEKSLSSIGNKQIMDVSRLFEGIDWNDVVITTSPNITASRVPSGNSYVVELSGASSGTLVISYKGSKIVHVIPFGN
ncbi:hypothetical protein GK047_22095 [Paenibacillus sp. SYP-B3998]|uniref:Uncharacterized protein n=2 Tax=Paenibacillus sp. SYP-B3998 TaxID=2678564 RepID=A0A6G4A2S8_9BACL|nr:hypothetical protein [Paenibacillus sp. SYP-B3998]